MTQAPSPLSSDTTLPVQLPHCSPKPLVCLLPESPLPLPSLKCTVGGTSLDAKRAGEGETPYPKYSPINRGLLYTPVCMTGCLEKCEAAQIPARCSEFSPNMSVSQIYNLGAVNCCHVSISYSDSVCGLGPDEAEHFQHLILILMLCPWCLFTSCHSERLCCLAPSSKMRKGKD